MKPKLLIVELWGVGDLVIATPFIRAAAEHYSVTLLAKPFALDLQPQFWPGVNVIPFDAPWTVFHHKYHVWKWPLGKMQALRSRIAAERFEAGVSARWDPRDHLLLKLGEIPRRLGFPRAGSRRLLTDPLSRPPATEHRYAYWRSLGTQLSIPLPSRDQLPLAHRSHRGRLIVHSGARLAARIWPLEKYRELVARLRAAGKIVEILCDANQANWWQQAGEKAMVPDSVTSLCQQLDRGDAFIGNCSGPGHLAAIIGLPTFTLFGPSLPEWFLPLHPLAAFVEGPACPFRPCSDYCHFAEPHCLTGLTVDETWKHLTPFLERISAALAKPDSPASQPARVQVEQLRALG